MAPDVPSPLVVLLGGRVLIVAWLRPFVATLLVAIVAAACTAAPTPTPSPSGAGESPVAVDDGERIAIIIGPPTHVPAAEAAALTRAAESLTTLDGFTDVAELRVLHAVDAEFAGDLVGLAVGDGFDLVCVVGSGTASIVADAARTHRTTRICGTDPRLDGATANAVAVGVDGIALVEVGAAAIGNAIAPVGLLVGAAVGDLETLRAAFEVALPSTPAQPDPEPEPAPAPSPSPSPSPSQTDVGADDGSPAPAPAPSASAEPLGPEASIAPSPTPAPSPVPDRPAIVAVSASVGEGSGDTAGSALAAAQPTRSLVLAASGGLSATQVLTAAGDLVVVADWVVNAEGELPSNVLVALTIDWSALLQRALAAGRDAASPQVTSLGLDTGVIGALAGRTDGATAAFERALQRIAAATTP